MDPTRRRRPADLVRVQRIELLEHEDVHVHVHAAELLQQLQAQHVRLVREAAQRPAENARGGLHTAPRRRRRRDTWGRAGSGRERAKRPPSRDGPNGTGRRDGRTSSGQELA